MIKGGENFLKRRSLVFLIICLVAALMFSACQPAQRPMPNDQQLTPDPRQPAPGQTGTQELTQTEMRVLANELSNMAESVDGVQRATVIAFNDTASPRQINVMVGITLDPQMTGQNTQSRQVQETVAQKIKESDKRISDVLVTTDPGLITQINDIATGIIQGQPIKNFANELKGLGQDIRRGMPGM